MTYSEAKAKLEKYGQEQLLRYYDELSDSEKQALLDQIDAADMSVVSYYEMCIRDRYTTRFPCPRSAASACALQAHRICRSIPAYTYGI